MSDLIPINNGTKNNTIEDFPELLEHMKKGVKPQKIEFRFHGTLEEFKKYMPELYEKIIKESDE